jgi:hypothetical protein
MDPESAEATPDEMSTSPVVDPAPDNNESLPEVPPVERPEETSTAPDAPVIATPVNMDNAPVAAPVPVESRTSPEAVELAPE